MSSALGFVIVRHVNSSLTNQYWQESYRCLRRFYPAEQYPILIVDDDSNQSLLTKIPLENCTVVASQYPRRGELLGYYYFHQTHFAEKAVIIHDSVFFQSHQDFTIYQDAKALWSFPPGWWENVPLIMSLLSRLNYSSELMGYFEKRVASHFFGVMSVIDWSFLDRLDKRYQLFAGLLPQVTNRESRMALERIMAVICHFNTCHSHYPPHVFGEILDPRWKEGERFSFERYQAGELSQLPIVKVWTGR